MPTYAIIHSANRVIKRLTVEEDHLILASEERVEVLDGMDLAPQDSTRFWKLTPQGRQVAATEDEADIAGIHEERITLRRRQARQDLRNATDAIIADPLIVGNMRDFFVAYRKLMP